MSKELLKSELREGFHEELTNLSLMRDYLGKSNRTEIEFSQLRNVDNLTLIDGGIKIPEIIAMKEKSGKTDIFRKSSKKHGADEIEELSLRTGLEKVDIISLMQDGMQLEEIGTRADNLPFKEIAESAAIREMIRKDIEPDQLALLQSKGIEIVAMKDGSLQVNQLEKLAEVDEKGMVTLSPDLQRQLEPFEQVGLLELSKGLAMQEIEPDEKELVDGKRGSYKVVPLDEKKAEKTREELEREEIARQLGEDPNNIVSVIRIEDREGGSKLFNDSLDQRSKPLIIRLRNNNFKVMEEKDDGTREELKGFEATPVSKQVASLIKDTSHNHDTYIRPGEIKAGKTSKSQERYNIFQIRKAGESVDNDSNQLLFVGFSGLTDLSLIESRENGNMAFADVPRSNLYPRSIYMEGNDEQNPEKEVVQGNEDPDQDISMASSMDYNAISEKAELIQELLYIESKIRELENEPEQTDDYKYDDSGTVDNDTEFDAPGVSKEEKISSLYSRRSQILEKLGLDPSRSIEQVEEEEYIRGSQRKPY